MKKFLLLLGIGVVLYVVYKMYTAFQPAPGTAGVSGLTETDLDTTSSMNEG